MDFLEVLHEVAHPANLESLLIQGKYFIQQLHFAAAQTLETYAECS